MASQVHLAQHPLLIRNIFSVRRVRGRSGRRGLHSGASRSPASGSRMKQTSNEQVNIGKLLEIIRDYCSFSAMFADVAYAFYHQGISQVSESLMLRRTHSGWSTHGLVLHKPAPPRPLTRCICEPVLTVSVSYRTTYSPPPKFSPVFTGYMLVYL